MDFFLQAMDRRRGELIEMNSDVVENAIRVVVSAIANQVETMKVFYWSLKGNIKWRNNRVLLNSNSFTR